MEDRLKEKEAEIRKFKNSIITSAQRKVKDISSVEVKKNEYEKNAQEIEKMFTDLQVFLPSQDEAEEI